MSEKMREEFEAWSKEKYPGTLLSRLATGVYVNLYVEMCWLGWQGSRESLVIELPDDGIEDCRKEWPERGGKYGYDTFDTGYLYACKKHEEAIEAAGLKVKP